MRNSDKTIFKQTEIPEFKISELLENHPQERILSQSEAVTDKPRPNY